MRDTHPVGEKEPYDARKARELTTCVSGYYDKHHEVVLKKIKHARTATHQSLQEYEDTTNDNEDSEELQNIKKYDVLWKELTELFKEAGISVDGLGKIEDILLTIPKIIKKYYDILVSQDKSLLKLMKEVASEKYSKAYEALKRMKSPPGQMSFNDLDKYRSKDGRAGYILKRVSSPEQRE